MALTINNNMFVDYANKNIKLDDIVIAYFDGIKWKIVPLIIMLQFSILHDIYNEQDGTTKLQISIYVCPNTLFSCVYFGKFELYDKKHCNNVAIINNENNYVLTPITNQMYSTITNKQINNFIRKGEVKILTYKNIMYLFPDSLFMNIDEIKQKINEHSINKGKLIYVIEYKSKSNFKYKYTIIIPKHDSYDIIKNGFGKYYHTMINSIRTKGGIIYPCLLDAWKNCGMDYKTVKL